MYLCWSHYNLKKSYLNQKLNEVLSKKEDDYKAEIKIHRDNKRSHAIK